MSAIGGQNGFGVDNPVDNPSDGVHPMGMTGGVPSDKWAGASCTSRLRTL